MNRRKFINLIGCSCLSFGLHSCATAPITDRKQLKLIPESKLNAQAAAIYEKVKAFEALNDLEFQYPFSLNENQEIGNEQTINFRVYDESMFNGVGGIDVELEFENFTGSYLNILNGTSTSTDENGFGSFTIQLIDNNGDYTSDPILVNLVINNEYLL